MPLGSLHPPAIIHIASRTKFSCMRKREEGLFFFEDNRIFLNRSRNMSSTPSGPLLSAHNIFSISLISLRIYPFACAHFPPCPAFTALISVRMSSCSQTPANKLQHASGPFCARGREKRQPKSPSNPLHAAVKPPHLFSCMCITSPIYFSIGNRFSSAFSLLLDLHLHPNHTAFTLF